MKDKRALLEAIFLFIFIGLIIGWFRPATTSVTSTSAPGAVIDKSVQSNEQKAGDETKELPAQTEAVAGTQGLETVDDVGGTYHVNVYTNKGAHYITDVTIKDLGSDIQVNGNYKGLRIPLTGKASGSRTKTTGTWNFSINLGIFKGNATATISSTKRGLFIKGQGAGTYFSLEEGSGSGSATGTGRRTSSAAGTTSGKAFLQGANDATSFAAPDRSYPNPDPVNTGAAAAASAAALLTSAGVSARNRIRKTKNSRSASSSGVSSSAPSDSSGASADGSRNDSARDAEQGGE